MSPETNTDHSRRWLILAVLGLAQLMVVLDATIVNIALPSAQADLGFSDGLASGSSPRTPSPSAGCCCSADASVTSSAASASSLSACSASPRLRDRRRRRQRRLLFGARALQGAFAALLAPAALSLMSTTFTDPKERGTAFGVYGAIAGARRGDRTAARRRSHRVPSTGAGLSSTSPSPSRRRSAPSVPRGPGRGTRAAHRHPRGGHRDRGLVALVYGFTKAETGGWGEPITIVASPPASCCCSPSCRWSGGSHTRCCRCASS